MVFYQFDKKTSVRIDCFLQQINLKRPIGNGKRLILFSFLLLKVIFFSKIGKLLLR